MKKQHGFLQLTAATIFGLVAIAASIVGVFLGTTAVNRKTQLPSKAFDYEDGLITVEAVGGTSFNNPSYQLTYTIKAEVCNITSTRLQSDAFFPIGKISLDDIRGIDGGTWGSGYRLPADDPERDGENCRFPSPEITITMDDDWLDKEGTGAIATAQWWIWRQDPQYPAGQGGWISPITLSFGAATEPTITSMSADCNYVNARINNDYNVNPASLELKWEARNQDGELVSRKTYTTIIAAGGDFELGGENKFWGEGDQKGENDVELPDEDGLVVTMTVTTGSSTILPDPASLTLNCSGAPPAPTPTDIPDTVTAEGIVVDSDGTTPIVGADVTIDGTSGNTDSDGEFTIVVSITPDCDNDSDSVNDGYSVDVSADGYNDYNGCIVPTGPGTSNTIADFGTIELTPSTVAPTPTGTPAEGYDPYAGDITYGEPEIDKELIITVAIGNNGPENFANFFSRKISYYKKPAGADNDQFDHFQDYEHRSVTDLRAGNILSNLYGGKISSIEASTDYKIVFIITPDGNDLNDGNNTNEVIFAVGEEPPTPTSTPTNSPTPTPIPPTRTPPTSTPTPFIGCHDISYALSTPNPSTPSIIRVDIDRAGGRSCYIGDHRWDNVGLKLDGANQGGGTIIGNTTYRWDNVNTSTLGSHTLQFTLNNGTCLCNSHDFITPLSTPAATPTQTQTCNCWEEGYACLKAEDCEPETTLRICWNCSSMSSNPCCKPKADITITPTPTATSTPPPPTLTPTPTTILSDCTLKNCQQDGDETWLDKTYYSKVEGDDNYGNPIYGYYLLSNCTSPINLWNYCVPSASGDGDVPFFETDLDDNDTTNSLDWAILVTDWVNGNYTALDASLFLWNWAGQN